jgi:hypothetical protein
VTRDDGTVQIRSHRNCFKLERRIHKIDRWRIPLPFGIPLRGLGYAIATALAMLVLGRLPGLGLALKPVTPVVRFVVVPIAVAYVLTRWELDGRPAHAMLRSWALMGLRSRRLVAWRPAPPPGKVALAAVTVAADERGARLRPAVTHGPARVLIRYPFRARARGRTLLIDPERGAPRWRGKEIHLRDGQRAVIR